MTHELVTNSDGPERALATIVASETVLVLQFQEYFRFWRCRQLAGKKPRVSAPFRPADLRDRFWHRIYVYIHSMEAYT